MDADRVLELGRKAREKGRSRSTSRALSSSAGSPSRLGLRPDLPAGVVDAHKMPRGAVTSSPLKDSFAGPSNGHAHKPASSSGSSSVQGLLITPQRKRKRRSRPDGAERSAGSSVVLVPNHATPSFGQTADAMDATSRAGPVTPSGPPSGPINGYCKASPLSPGKTQNVAAHTLGGAPSSQAIVVDLSDDESLGFEIIEPEVARKEIAAKVSASGD